MIKNVFYGLAIVLAGAAAFFGASTNGKLKQAVSDYEDAYSSNQEVSRRIEKEEERLAAAKESFSVAREARDTAEASLDNERSKEGTLKRDVGAIDAEIEELNAEMTQIQARISEAQALISNMIPEAGNNLSVDDVVAYLEQLENTRKAKEEELEEKELIAERLASQLQKAQEQRDRLQGRLGTTRERISKNRVSVAVTSVDNDWGFAVINRGSENSNITSDSKLIVSRNGSYIGRLKVSSLGPTQTVVDFVDDSFKPGQRVQVGDRVVLEEPAAN